MDNEYDIAIVGVACHFPGARNYQEFWRNLDGGVESIARLSDQEMLEAGVPTALLARPDFVKASPILEDPSLFDAAFFGFAPSEADTLDPQHRLLLELAHAALEDAACDPARFPGRIGVFTGSAMNSYFINSGLSARLTEDYIPTLIGNDKDFLSTRLSYKLGLRGPSITVQTACSTSLVAIHLARQSLLNEESDMALAGAVSIRVPHRAGYLYDGSGVVSPDGHVRAFDADANGTVFGSGAGVIVMKRLADALAQGDPIHAVIKGSAVNNDGSAKAGYTAPSVNGQADVVVEALANAGVDAESISYIEAHGSGTPVGDPIELLALTKAFRNFTQRNSYCAIGSVKTNVGHLDAAAGMAGLIKTVLALKHRRLPPTLHYSKPNPEIDFPATPFYVNTTTVDWAHARGPRRAGVMSTGMGGTNAHVVLEEAPADMAVTGSDGPQLLLLSAKTPSALDAMSCNLADFLAAPASCGLPAEAPTDGEKATADLVETGQEQTPNPGLLADTAYTLQMGRGRFAYRRFVVCNRTVDAVATLRESGTKTTCAASLPDQSSRPVVFLLPGVGDHYVGMGQELYKHFKVFREEMDRCAAILQPLLNLDVRALLYAPERAQGEPTKPRGIDLKRMLGRGTDEPADPAAQKLDETIHCQPALFSLEYSLARLWLDWGVKPDRLVGHSMGEYVAACLAGVFSLEDALRLVSARARLVNNLPTGSMLAVMLPEDKLLPLLGEQLSLSLINGPDLCVVAGPVAAVADFQNRLKESEVIFRTVRNAHAFHSRMLDPIKDAFAKEVKQVRLNAPNIPFISNVTGTWITAEQACDPAYWVDHACRTARFSDALEQMWKIPDCLPLEAGPGRTLGVLAMQHPSRAAVPNPMVLSSLRHDYENQSDSDFILNSIGRLWLAGIEIDWDKLDSGASRRRLSLPTYPFERQSHWIQNKINQQSGSSVAHSIEPKADIADWFYIPSWERTGFRDDTSSENAKGTLWIVMGDRSDFSKRIMSALAQRGELAVQVSFGESYFRRNDGTYVIRPAILDDYLGLFEALKVGSSQSLNILHLGPLSSRVKPAAAGYNELSQELGFYSLLNIAKAIGELNISLPVRLGVVTSQIHEVTGEEDLNPSMATILGPCGVIPKEYPNMTSFSVDFLAMPRAAQHLDQLILHLLREFREPSKGSVIAYRGKYRWERGYKPHKLTEVTPQAGEQRLHAQRLRPRGVYLITGGTGGIGLAIAKYLAETCQARLILTKKTPFPQKSVWRQQPAAPDVTDSDQRIISALLEIEALGGEVDVCTCDVTNQAGMERTVAQSLAKHHVINGVIHAAGIIGVGLMEVKTKDSADRVLSPKVPGSIALAEALKAVDLDFFMFVSSLASVTMPFAHVDYCAAHAFMDAFAHHLRAKTGCRTLAINWPIWREVGMVTKMKAQTGLGGWREETLKKAIATQDGLEAFKRALASDFVQVVVSPRALGEVLEEEGRVRMESLENAASSSTANTNHAGVIGRMRPKLQSGFVPPRTPTEHELASLWREVLGVDQVGIHDDFFELGGHSLLAVRLFSKIEKLAGRKLPLATLFEARTIDALSRRILQEREKQRSASSRRLNCVVPIRTGGSRPPFFCIHGIGGNVLNYEDIAGYFDMDQPVYGVQSRGLSGLPLDTSVEAMATAYIEEILQVQPEGPYLVGGHSFGGLVAYEIACQLEAAGRPVDLVALIDSRANYNEDERFWISFTKRTSLLYDRIQGHVRKVVLGPDRIGYLRARRKTLRRKAGIFIIQARLRLSRKSGEDLLANLKNVKQVNYLAAYRYVPRPYKGCVTLFRCISRGLGDHPDYLMGWRPLAQGGVHVEEVPGDHVSMSTEPHVQVLAEKLCACVRNASKTPGTLESVDVQFQASPAR